MEAQDISTVAVIGAGTMGSVIAGEFARAGCDVHLVDLDDNLLQRGIKTLRNAQKALIEAQFLSAQQAQDDYIRSVAGTETTADQLKTLSELHDAGKLSDEEFAAQKAKLLG